MGLSLTQLEDIKQKIQEGLSDRQIAKAVGRRRTLISEIRSGEFVLEKNSKFPDWMSILKWDEILKDIGLKHPIKFIWDDYAKDITSYSNFTKYIYKKYPYLKIDSYTHREFNPGERVEVDWAGDIIKWINPVDGKINNAYLFVGCLCYSQLIFAKAFTSMREIDFLSGHEAMFLFYDGVTHSIVPDNAKTAVIKANRYDPDLNPEYDRFTKYYGVTVAPARVYTPKDKALVEGAVKIIQRFFRWRFRKHTFTSLKEINDAIKETVEITNNKKHCRFKISRLEMFNLEEKLKLKPLPVIKYELSETKFCKVHPDGTVALNHHFYSVPYRLVGESVLTKIYANTVEIYHKLEKIAVHPKLIGVKGKKSIQVEHIPESSQIYRNTTVQFTIQQAQFLSLEFKIFIEELLTENPSGNLRRAQGFLREARALKAKVSLSIFKEAVKKSIEEMKLFNQVRVHIFKINMIKNYELLVQKPNLENIERDRTNPMLRSNNTLH